MKRAVIVVDMIRDNVYTPDHGVREESGKIIPAIQKLLSFARQRGILVVYASDSFMPDDLIFRGRMKPHAIRGTEGSQVIVELAPQPGDVVLDKRRFSAFFRTDLDITLRELGIEEVAVTGIATQVCVLLTALDAVALDFRATLLEDCCASYNAQLHEQALAVYRRSPLDPLFQVETLGQFMDRVELEREG